MKKTLGFLIVSMVVASLSVAAQGASAIAPYRALSPAEAKRMLEQDKTAVLLDVRTPDEYAQRHIPGSVLIPDYELAARMGKELPDKNAPIIVYCRSGNRSRNAALRLLQAGYTRVYDAGGINAWPYPTETGPYAR